MTDNKNSLQLLRCDTIFASHEAMITALDGKIKYNDTFAFLVGEPFVLFYKDGEDNTCLSLFVAKGEKEYEEINDASAIAEIVKRVEDLEGRMDIAEGDIDALETLSTKVIELCGFKKNAETGEWEYKPNQELVKDSKSLADAIDAICVKINNMSEYKFKDSYSIHFEEPQNSNGEVDITAYVNISNKDHSSDFGANFDDTNIIVLDELGIGTYFDIIKNPSGKLVLRKAYTNKEGKLDLERTEVPVAPIAMSGKATDVTLDTEVLSTHNLEEAIVKLANASISHTIIELPESEKVLVLKKEEIDGQVKYTLSANSWDATATLTDEEKHHFVPTVAASVTKAELDQVVNEASTINNAPSTQAVYKFVDVNVENLENAIKAEETRAIARENQMAQRDVDEELAREDADNAIRADVDVIAQGLTQSIAKEILDRQDADTAIRTDVNATFEQVNAKIAEVEALAEKHTEIAIPVSELALKAVKEDNVYTISIEKIDELPSGGHTDNEHHQVPSVYALKEEHLYTTNADAQLKVAITVEETARKAEDAAIRTAYKLADDSITAAYKLADTGIETAYKLADTTLKSDLIGKAKIFGGKSSDNTVYGAKIYADEAIENLDSTVTQSSASRSDGLYLQVVQSNGKLTSVTGSIDTSKYDTAGKATQALTDAKAYTDNVKNTIDNYTVNGYKISNNPSIAGSNVLVGGTGEHKDSYVSENIEALYSNIKNIEAIDVKYNNTSNVAAELEKIEGEATVEGSIKKAVADAKAELETEIDKVDTERTIIPQDTFTAKVTANKQATGTTLFVDVKKSEDATNAIVINETGNTGLYVPNIGLSYDKINNTLILTRGTSTETIELVGVNVFKSITYDPTTHTLTITYVDDTGATQTTNIDLSELITNVTVIGNAPTDNPKIRVTATEITELNGVYNVQVLAQPENILAQDIKGDYHDWDPGTTLTNVEDALQHLQVNKLGLDALDDLKGTATIAINNGGAVTIKGGVKQVAGEIENDDAKADVTLAKVATTGKAEDVSIDSIGSLSADNVQDALEKIQTEIAGLSGVGRFLGGWKCDEGAPASFSGTYVNGDYYVVSKVSVGGTNYRPYGTSTSATPVVEGATVKPGYYYSYSGDGNWALVEVQTAAVDEFKVDTLGTIKAAAANKGLGYVQNDGSGYGWVNLDMGTY